MTPRAGFVLTLLLGIAGCKRTEPTPVRETPSAAPSQSAAPLANTPEELGPPAAGASRDEHERLALSILTGERSANRLPVMATESGGDLDMRLRDEVAPVKPGAKVRAGRLTVTGKLPEELVRRFIRRDFPRFIGCYDRGLALNPTVTGDVVVRFTIDARGNVKNAANDASTLPDQGVVECVVKVFSELKFPEPDGDVTVQAPLSFQPPD